MKLVPITTTTTTCQSTAQQFPCKVNKVYCVRQDKHMDRMAQRWGVERRAEQNVDDDDDDDGVRYTKPYGGTPVYHFWLDCRVT